jgi:hypothetical protein
MYNSTLALSALNVAVDGNNFTGGTASAINNAFGMCFMVAPGKGYSAVMSGGTTVLVKWLEIR